MTDSNMPLNETAAPAQELGDGTMPGFHSWDGDRKRDELHEKREMTRMITACVFMGMSAPQVPAAQHASTAVRAAAAADALVLALFGEP